VCPVGPAPDSRQASSLSRRLRPNATTTSSIPRPRLLIRLYNSDPPLLSSPLLSSPLLSSTVSLSSSLTSHNLFLLCTSHSPPLISPPRACQQPLLLPACHHGTLLRDGPDRVQNARGHGAPGAQQGQVVADRRPYRHESHGSDARVEGMYSTVLRFRENRNSAGPSE
jgi:hypothetical protein